MSDLVKYNRFLLFGFHLIACGQDTFCDYNGTPISTTSGEFTIHVVPEPLTLGIIAAGALSIMFKRS